MICPFHARNRAFGHRIRERKRRQVAALQNQQVARVAAKVRRRSSLTFFGTANGVHRRVTAYTTRSVSEGHTVSQPVPSLTLRVAAAMGTRATSPPQNSHVGVYPQGHTALRPASHQQLTGLGTGPPRRQFDTSIRGTILEGISSNRLSPEGFGLPRWFVGKKGPVVSFRRQGGRTGS